MRASLRLITVARQLALAFAACALTCLNICACSSSRAPIPVGAIPYQQPLSAEDQRYGNEVYHLLVKNYPLDHNASRRTRVEAVVARLTTAPQTSAARWHVYLLEDSSMKNAAATRGNNIFVWSGIFSVVHNDAELATVLGHEIAHVLAGHTKATPLEEVNSTLSGLGGSVARETVLAHGVVAPVGQLAGLAVDQALRAFLVNPEAQREEYEADQIGLFLLADTGFNPDRAVRFWENAKDDPDFRSQGPQFLSSHPASEKRLERLRDLAPLARERYQRAIKIFSPLDGVASNDSAYSPAPIRRNPGHPARDLREEFIVNKDTQPSDAGFSYGNGADHSLGTDNHANPDSSYSDRHSVWRVELPEINVFSEPSLTGQIVSSLKQDTTFVANDGDLISNQDGHWLEVINPVRGYVLTRGITAE